MSSLKILVPLDGSAFAETALPAAVSLARNLEASIDIVSVFEEESLLATNDLTPSQFKQWLDRYLCELSEQLASASGLTCTYSLIDGSPANQVLEYATRAKVDLVAMSTHGRGALSRAWLGSVADEVIRNVAVPVLLVRADESGSSDITQAMDFRRIVVALDGSELAEQSLDWALRIVKKTKGSLTLLRAVEPPLPFTSPYLPHAVVDTQAALEVGKAVSEEYLSDLDRRLRVEGVEVHTETLLGEHPAQGILELSRSHPVDLIAIATHGRTGVARIVLGSVADKVVRGSSTPVLLIRPAETQAARRFGADHYVDPA